LYFSEINFESFFFVLLFLQRYKPANENQIYKALQVLDTERKGYYTKEDIIRLMTTEGEPFNADEINDMLQTCLACVDPDSQPDNPHILYKYYINELIDDDMKE
jgi:Ca2+-binding EF-hand superfamily protein